MVLIVRRNGYSNIVFIYMLYRIGGVWNRNRVDVGSHTTDIVILRLVSREGVQNCLGTHQDLGFGEDVFQRLDHHLTDIHSCGFVLF